MPKEKPMSNFHKIMEEASENASALFKAYSVDKVAKLLGTSKTYAQKKVREMKKKGFAMPVRKGGETVYTFNADGLAYLMLDEYGRRINEIDKEIESSGLYILDRKLQRRVKGMHKEFDKIKNFNESQSR